ncbi:hypothetical protein, partial [Streptomyces sp. NPDC127092]|uniref:hypothetical protein n=1 Tax=Streptomyces sp. NPDC127092 TaxID=3347135 RepID=UPI00364A2E8E
LAGRCGHVARQATAGFIRANVPVGSTVAQFGALLPVGAAGEEGLADLGDSLAGMLGGRGAGCAGNEPVLGLLAVRAG